MPDPQNRFSSRFFMVVVCALLALTPAAFGQATTGTITGAALAADGSALPGVTVEAVHTPTGTRYDTVTAGDGRFTIPNVRVGGPYRITGTLEGFRTFESTNTQVSLGTPVEVTVRMSLATVTEAITVTATADDIINPNRTGSTSKVGEEQIETLPTVNRSLQDFARTNPYFVVDSEDISATRMNVAGRNNRYNSIQIDGAVNNDLFGLADTGTPGGQTDAQPISLDAIQEIQLVVSPYDVRQGGFTGGGINAITRSGTNEISGSVFGSYRSPDLIGNGPRDTEPNDFEYSQYGGRFGGPILRDRLFFFVNGEVTRRDAPTGVSADGSGTTNYGGTGTGATPSAQLVREFVQQKYNFDPGPLSDFPSQTNSDNVFGRVDWNVNSAHQLTLRHNHLDATRDVISDRSSSRFRFPTSIYTIADITNSSVAQLNSVFGPDAYNEARLNYTTIRDKRATPVLFPTVEIGGTGPRSGAVHIGTERFSGANALDQDVLALTDDFTLVRGNHTITLGTHNEFFEFKNLFMSEAYGYYYFRTLDDFIADRAQEYRVTLATGNDPRRPTAFEAAQYGLYVNDSWRVNNQLSLVFGIRADMPRFGDTPTFNQKVQDLIGFNTAETASEGVVLSPRIGFNWSPGGEQQLRGGIGVFAGRTPYVWISNVYGNTGVEQVALSCTGSCVRPSLEPDPFNQPTNFSAGGGAFSVDLIDPDFEFPRVLRATLGYDRQLFFGVRGSAEVLWSQSQQDVFYYNVNRRATGIPSALDGRPTFTQVNAGIFDAIQLSNTSRGEEVTATLQLNRPFSNGLILNANYAWQDAKSAFDATSSRAISNWQFRPTPGDIFEDDLSTSAFQVEHRFNISAVYDLATGPLTHNIGLFYNVQSGAPYSLMMGGDPNRDLYASNDLLFVPGGADSFILCPSGASRAPVAAGPCVSSSNSQLAPLNSAAFVDWLAAAGVSPDRRITDRNELREPWSRQLDFHYGLGLPISRFRTEITADVNNLLNMIDSDYGVTEFVNFQTFTPVVWTGNDPTTGKPVYRENFSGSATRQGSQFSLADFRSRWTARLGVRVSF